MLNILKKIIQGSVLKYLDNMKQPAAILVLPVFYQNLPVSAILVQILVNTSIPVFSRIFQELKNDKTGFYKFTCTFAKLKFGGGF